MSVKTSVVFSNDEYTNVVRGIVAFKGKMEKVNQKMAAGNIDIYEVRNNIYLALDRQRKANEATILLTGINQAAKDRESDQVYDLIVELTALNVLISNTITLVETSIPAVSGFIGFEDWNNGVITSREFTSGQTAALRTSIDLIIAEIDNVT